MSRRNPTPPPEPPPRHRVGIRAVEFRNGGLLRLELLDVDVLTMHEADRAFLEALLQHVTAFDLAKHEEDKAAAF